MTEEQRIRRSILFGNLSDEEYQKGLQFFHARTAEYQKGDFLLGPGNKLNAFGMVLSGTVQVFMDDIDGQPIIMANVEAGETFGESLCYLGILPQIYICASLDVRVLWMQTDWKNVYQSQTGESEMKFINRFITLLSERTLHMNDRIQILSKLTLRDKLITFFSQQKSRYGKNCFEVPFDRNDMAVYLGTNRSALSRELSKMKEEGLLSFQHNRFTIHNEM